MIIQKLMESSNNIYLIKKLWIDCFQVKEDKTYGYEIVGYVKTIEEVENYIDQNTTKDFDVNDCWSIKGLVPEFIYEQISAIE